MTARVLILAGSIALNAAWIGAFLLRPSLAPEFVRSTFASETATAHPKTPAQITNAAKAAAENLSRAWSTLATDDLPTLVSRLRAAGFPASVVRAIVSAEVDQRFRARLQALASSIQDAPYWQPTPTNLLPNTRLFEERQQAYRDRAKMMRDLLGDEAFAAAGVDPTAAQRRQFGDLSKAKIDLVQRISDDYAEMISQVRAATDGIMLPEDRVKLALLEREKQADLAAILTPQELDDYEMRNSPLTARLRTAFTLMNATEEEFRAIYRAQLPFAELLDPSMMAYSSQDVRRRQDEAHKTIAAQLTEKFGAARYADFARAQHSEFQQLAQLAQRENLPTTAAVRAFDLRSSTAEESMRISRDRTLSRDQKLTALQTLAQTTRTQLTSALGPTAGPAYTQSANWLKAIETGTAVSFSPDGRFTIFQPIPPPSTPPRK